MDIENRFVVAKGEWGGSGMDGDFGVDKAITLEWKIDEDLPHCTGNYSQSLGTKHDGR